MNCKKEIQTCMVCGQPFVLCGRYQKKLHGEILYYFCSKKCLHDWFPNEDIDE